MRRYARHVFAYEPMPSLAQVLREKFPRRVTVEAMALSDSSGTVELRSPVVNGVVVTGCSTISDEAAATYPGLRAVEVPMERLDSVYRGNVGFIKIDVEGHEQAVLDGAIEIIRRCRPAPTSPISAIAASSCTTATSSRSSGSRSTACSTRPTCPISPRRCRRASASAATSTTSSSCRRTSRK
jgi:FkbM family methyltransferase